MFSTAALSLVKFLMFVLFCLSVDHNQKFIPQVQREDFAPAEAKHPTWPVQSVQGSELRWCRHVSVSVWVLEELQTGDKGSFSTTETGAVKRNHISFLCSQRWSHNSSTCGVKANKRGLTDQKDELVNVNLCCRKMNWFGSCWTSFPRSWGPASALPHKPVRRKRLFCVWSHSDERAAVVWLNLILM